MAAKGASAPRKASVQDTVIRSARQPAPRPPARLAEPWAMYQRLGLGTENRQRHGGVGDFVAERTLLRLHRLEAGFLRVDLFCTLRRSLTEPRATAGREAGRWRLIRVTWLFTSATCWVTSWACCCRDSCVPRPPSSWLSVAW